MDISRLQHIYESEILYLNFVSHKVSQSKERITICSNMTGNASPFDFASHVRFVFVDANSQYIKCLRQDALVSLFIEQIRPGHVYDTAIAEACTAMAS